MSELSWNKICFNVTFDTKQSESVARRRRRQAIYLVIDTQEANKKISLQHPVNDAASKPTPSARETLAHLSLRWNTLVYIVICQMRENSMLPQDRHQLQQQHSASSISGPRRIRFSATQCLRRNQDAFRLKRTIGQSLHTDTATACVSLAFLCYKFASQRPSITTYSWSWLHAVDRTVLMWENLPLSEHLT